jgi:uncharacterized protein (TIGR02466 family)
MAKNTKTRNQVVKDPADSTAEIIAANSAADIVTDNTPEIVGDVVEIAAHDLLNQNHYFSAGVYTINRPEFLTMARTVSKEYIAKSKQEITMDKIYPVIMSGSFFDDKRIQPLADFILSTARTVLDSQGYNMNLYQMTYHEMWCQEHYQYSGQEEHIHPHAHISGFYFLDVPKDSQRVIFHDPRPAKVYSNLAESNMANATYASTMINYVPEPGMLMLTNSWLPHSFTKNPSKTAMRFIHFNLGVTYVPPACDFAPAEVV